MQDAPDRQSQSDAILSALQSGRRLTPIGGKLLAVIVAIMLRCRYVKDQQVHSDSAQTHYRHCRDNAKA